VHRCGYFSRRSMMGFLPLQAIAVETADFAAKALDPD
jgi:hypothetical protein